VESGKTSIPQTVVSKTSIAETSIAKTSMSKTGIAETSMSKTGITKTSIRMSNIGSVAECWWVMDKGSGGSDDPGGAIEDSSISLTPLSLSRGSSSSDKSKVGSLSFSNLRGVLDWVRSNTGKDWGNKRLWVEGGGNKRLGVEGGSDSSIDWSNGQTGVSNTESSSISNIFDLLKLTVGINIRVSTSDSTISVSDNMSIGVNVGITVVQVSELILGMELASSRVRSISSISWGSSNNWSSSNWGRSSSISISWGSGSIGKTSGSIRKTSITSIGKATVGITISQRGGYNLGLFSQANGHESRQGNLELKTQMRMGQKCF
jgi:hypothetical protein